MAQSKKARVPIGSRVEDHQSAISFANELLSASGEHLSDDATIEWNILDNAHGVTIEGTEATGDRGPLRNPSNSNPLVRASILLGGISAPQMYDFLKSKEGYMFLDPDADPDHFGKAMLGPYSWHRDSIIQVESASLKLPFFLANRDYVVLNAFSGTSRSFISVSCFSPSVSAETSPYEDAPQKNFLSCCGTVRMAIYGVYSVVEAESASSCILKVAQYVDFNGWFPAKVNKQINIAWFKSFIDRAQKRFPVTLPEERKKEK